MFAPMGLMLSRIHNASITLAIRLTLNLYATRLVMYSLALALSTRESYQPHQKWLTKGCFWYRVFGLDASDC